MSSASSVVVVDGEIGVTKAELENKEQAAAGSFAGEEIGVTKKAEPGNKEEVVAGKGVVTEADWIEFVFPVKPPPGITAERKAEPTTGAAAVITKERVPECLMDRLRERRVFKRLPPLPNSSGVFDEYPKARDFILATVARWNYLVGLHEDVLKLHAEKGFAEVGRGRRLHRRCQEDLYPSPALRSLSFFPRILRGK
jgi:hypothetical protein